MDLPAESGTSCRRRGASRFNCFQIATQLGTRLVTCLPGAVYYTPKLYLDEPARGAGSRAAPTRFDMPAQGLYYLSTK